jgi:hypothetical protein
LPDTERAAGAADEGGLSRAELAGDRDHVAGRQLLGDARADRLGLLG